MIPNKKPDHILKNGLIAISHPILLTKRITYNLKRGFSDTLAHFDYYKYPNKIIFLAGMAMSASTWMKNLCGRIPGYYSRSIPMPIEISYYQNICDSAFNYVPSKGYSLIKTHLNPTQENLECIRRNGVDKILITYRDLRDVVLSRYHRLIVFPKPMSREDFIDYNALGKEKAINHSIKHVAKVYTKWIKGWLEIAKENQNNYHFTKFEDLKLDTKGEFKKVLKFYQINLDEQKINNIIELSKGTKSMKKNIKDARVLPNSINSNFRSGKIGNWKKEMSNNHIEMCKELLGTSLIELGYEKDLDW